MRPDILNTFDWDAADISCASPLPLFVIVTVIVLLWPTATLPKLADDGENVSELAALLAGAIRQNIVTASSSA